MRSLKLNISLALVGVLAFAGIAYASTGDISFECDTGSGNATTTMPVGIDDIYSLMGHSFDTDCEVINYYLSNGFTVDITGLNNDRTIHVDPDWVYTEGVAEHLVDFVTEDAFDEYITEIIGFVNALPQASQSDWNQSSTTAIDYIKNKPSIPSVGTLAINNNVSRSLNSNYTISTSSPVLTSYSINASWTLNALLSGTGSAFLEYSTNSGSSWITVNQVSKTLNLLTVAGNDDMNLTGYIPANALVRIRTTSTNMTVSYVRGQEVFNP